MPILFIGLCLLLLVGVVLSDASDILEGDVISILVLPACPDPLLLRGVIASLAMSSSKLLSISPFSTSTPLLECALARIDALREGSPGECAEIPGPPERNKVDEGSRSAASKSGPPRLALADEVDGRDDAEVDGRMLILSRRLSCQS